MNKWENKKTQCNENDRTRVTGLARDVSRVLSCFLSKYLIKNLFALRGQSRKLHRPLRRGLNSFDSLLVPDTLQCRRQVLQSIQEPTVRLIRVMGREASIDHARLWINFSHVALGARGYFWLTIQRLFRVRKPVLPCSGVCKVHQPNIQLATSFTIVRSFSHRPNQKIFAMRAAQ